VVGNGPGLVVDPLPTQTARVAALEETVRKMSDVVFTKQLVTRYLRTGRRGSTPHKPGDDEFGFRDLSRPMSRRHLSQDLGYLRASFGLWCGPYFVYGGQPKWLAIE